MSVNPVLAALIGFVIVSQTMEWIAWPAIATIAAANAVSVVTGDGTS